MTPSNATTSYVQLASKRLEQVDGFLRDGFVVREDLRDILCKLAHTEDATAQLAPYAAGDGPLTDSFIIDMLRDCVILRLEQLFHQFFLGDEVAQSRSAELYEAIDMVDRKRRIL
jgi:hypothetical protein